MWSSLTDNPLSLRFPVQPPYDIKILEHATFKALFLRISFNHHPILAFLGLESPCFVAAISPDPAKHNFSDLSNRRFHLPFTRSTLFLYVLHHTTCILLNSIDTLICSLPLAWCFPESMQKTLDGSAFFAGVLHLDWMLFDGWMDISWLTVLFFLLFSF